MTRPRRARTDGTPRRTGGAPERQLRRLRAEIAGVDRAIHRLVRSRLDLARRVGTVKQRNGWSVRDLRTEARVVQRFRTSLARVGVPSERSDRLARWLVDESVRVQEEASLASQRRDAGTKVLVVGGRGAMGRWLVGYLADRGYAVTIHDTANATPTASDGLWTEDLVAKFRGVDYIAIATPISAGATIYRAICRNVPPATIFDLFSVKEPILPWIHRARSKGARVTSVHPLFGPRPFLLSDRRMLLLDCGDASATRHVARLFEPGPLAISRLPVEQHDAWMADLQALPILTNLLFLHALRGGALPPDEVGHLAPPTFERQAEASRAVLRENPVLSFDMLTANPNVVRLCARLRTALPVVARVLKAAEFDAYRALLSESERWMAQGTNVQPLDREPPANR
jgi:chorismate mutase / prephenate dehydrogenase